MAGGEGIVRGLGAVLVGLLCLGAAPEAGDVALDYRAPATCPDADAFRERAADAFDFHDPFVAQGEAAATQMRVEVTRTSTGYQATISVLDEEGSPVTSSTEASESCDALVWALGHRMALAIAKPPALAVPAGGLDKRLQRRLDAIEEASEAQAEAIDALNRKIAEQSRQIAELKRKGPMDLTFALATGALITANLTSNVGPGVWLAGEARSGPLALGLELRAALPSQVTLGPYDFDTSVLSALLTPCGRYSYFFGCVVAGAGLQIDHDSDAPSPTGLFGLLQLGGRVGVEVPFGDTMFGARAWGEVLYSTPGVQEFYDPGGYVWTRPDVSAFFGVGLVVRFGEGEEGAR